MLGSLAVNRTKAAIVISRYIISRGRIMVDQQIDAIGDCLCGSIKVSISGKSLRMGQCHCRDCQKASGGGHMSLIFIAEEAVSVSGSATGFDVITDSGNTSTRNFCPKCGSRMFGSNTLRPGVIAVPVGIFEDRSWFKPEAVVYCRNRDDWDNTRENIPNFEMMPPAPS